MDCKFEVPSLSREAFELSLKALDPIEQPTSFEVLTATSTETAEL